jgi:hypothetical protein
MTHVPIATTSAPTYSPSSDRDLIVTAPPEPWSRLQLFSFRFLVIYFLLYTFPGPIGQVPYLDVLGKPADTVWRALVPWIGAHVLHLSHPISLRPSGSGDKLFDWVQVFTMLMLAMLAAVAWTLVDRKPRAHVKLAAAFRLFLRFQLAGTLLGYGFDKIFPNQFEAMNPLRLTQYFGEASPGGFAWSFLGLSVAYEIFAGAMETLAATLLLFRRTSTLGAVIGAATLANVFMLNMSFDIPVKQYSGHLLLMCIVLIVYDADRLLNVFVRQRAADGPRFVELFTTRRSLIAARLFGAFLVACMIVQDVRGEYQGLHQYGRLAPREPLYGIYEVDNVVKNGVTQPPLLTDVSRWRRLAVATYGARVRLVNDSLVPYRIHTDSSTHVTTFTPYPDTLNRLVGSYVFPDSSHLVIRARTGSDSVEIAFTRRREDSYLLVKRGFRWVNEFPYFR